jgi:hypothetical protein
MQSPLNQVEIAAHLAAKSFVVSPSNPVFFLIAQKECYCSAILPEDLWRLQTPPGNTKDKLQLSFHTVQKIN